MNTTRFARKGAQRSWSELGEKRSVHKVTITALSVTGGIDVKDSVWRVMKRCFTNPLAKQLNWGGINGKTAFHKTIGSQQQPQIKRQKPT
ncbi:hypothetical protein FQN60_005331 [Etheostoma spectabile]|uniref:Uncharacterized protein n=1 Tax=Etheostoma spectabile TaxID=54343 RepID=A0A5J5CC29_9PERO|nr:hypothetical protein FQN60_005331 [Etheostoma spectabile]